MGPWDRGSREPLEPHRRSEDCQAVWAPDLTAPPQPPLPGAPHCQASSQPWFPLPGPPYSPSYHLQAPQPHPSSGPLPAMDPTSRYPQLRPLHFQGSRGKVDAGILWLSHQTPEEPLRSTDVSPPRPPKTHKPGPELHSACARGFLCSASKVGNSFLIQTLPCPGGQPLPTGAARTLMTTGATRCCPEQEGTSPEALTPSVLQFSDTKTEVPPGSALQGDSGSLTGPGTPPGQWKDTDTGEAPSSAARKNTGTESRAAQKSPHPCPRSAKQCCAETRSCPRNQMGTFCGESCADFYHHARLYGASPGAAGSEQPGSFSAGAQALGPAPWLPTPWGPGLLPPGDGTPRTSTCSLGQGGNTGGLHTTGIRWDASWALAGSSLETAGSGGT